MCLRNHAMFRIKKGYGMKFGICVNICRFMDACMCVWVCGVFEGWNKWTMFYIIFFETLQNVENYLRIIE